MDVSVSANSAAVAVLEVAFREQDRQRGVPVEVRVDVGGDVDAARTRGVEDPNEAVGVAPQRPHGELRVRDLHGELRLAPDAR